MNRNGKKYLLYFTQCNAWSGAYTRERFRAMQPTECLARRISSNRSTGATISYPQSTSCERAQASLKCAANAYIYCVYIYTLPWRVRTALQKRNWQALKL